MITKLLIDLVLGVPTWLLSQIPSLSLPAEITGTGDGSIVGGITSAAAAAGSLNNWVPMGSVINALAFVLLCFGIALGVKLTRIIASFLTGGGGSAA